MDFRVRLQLAEACGPLNCWFCSQAHGREIDHRKIEEQEILLEHYIKSGGAADFAKRYARAMSALNRWYCSEYYRREIHDPEILWQYFIKNAPAGTVGKDRRIEPADIQAEMSVAC